MISSTLLLHATILPEQQPAGQKLIVRLYYNLENTAKDLSRSSIFNFDETNITDNPREKKVLVPRGTRQVERVHELSKMKVSLICCGSASEAFLPPFLVYTAQNLYENWTKGGPEGAGYACSKSTWFNMDTFE